MGDRTLLSIESADKMMPDGDYVHTFMQAHGPGLMMLIGADMKRAKILSAQTLELAGDNAKAMGHGIAAQIDGDWVFVKTKNATE